MFFDETSQPNKSLPRSSFSGPSLRSNVQGAAHNSQWSTMTENSSWPKCRRTTRRGSAIDLQVLKVVFFWFKELLYFGRKKQELLSSCRFPIYQQIHWILGTSTTMESTMRFQVICGILELPSINCGKQRQEDFGHFCKYWSSHVKFHGSYQQFSFVESLLETPNTIGSIQY